MSKKVAIPLMLVSLGIFVATQNIGCGGSDNNGAGGSAGSSAGGKGGSSAGGATGTGGRGGTAGTGTGTGGTAGTGAGGRGGTAGTGTGGTAGSGTGGTAGAGAGGTAGARDGGTDTTTDAPTDTVTPTDTGSDADPGLQRAAALCPFYPNTPPDAGYSMGRMSAADFCQIYISLCTTAARDGSAPAYASSAACMTAYNGMQDAGNATYGTKQTCESAHICNAYNLGNPTTGTLNTHCPHSEGAGPCAN